MNGEAVCTATGAPGVLVALEVADVPVEPVAVPVVEELADAEGAVSLRPYTVKRLDPPQY